MGALLTRDFKLALRNPAQWVMGLIFFALFLMISAIALGGDTAKMRPLAPALIWMAVILSQLLGFNTLFAQDYDDGTLEQLILAGLSPYSIAASKALGFFILAFLPVLAAVPLISLAFNVNSTEISGILLALLIAAPALTSYNVMTAAILTGRPNAGFLSLIMTTPFLIPVLIFGISAVDNYAGSGLGHASYQALGALSLIGVSIGIPAAGAALSTHME